MASPTTTIKAVEALFQPFTLAGKAMRNRIVMAPMTRARAGKSLLANDIMKVHYEQRASAGLIITEGTHISPKSRGWVDVPGIWTEEQTEAWKPVVEAVHDKGGLIYCQLWHQGRDSHSSFHGGPPFSASEVAYSPEHHVHAANNTKVPPETPHAMTKDEINETVQDYVRAAKNAIAAGFDGVEIHNANGYLLDQFLQSKTNKRTDEYGGSVENRFRFSAQVLDAVVEAIGKEHVGIRFSPNGAFNEMGSEDFRETFKYAITEAGKRGIAFVHVMDGLGFGFHGLGEQFTLREARECLPKDVALIGNCGHTPEVGAELIAKGDGDLIAYGRPFLGNPDFVERVANGWPMADPPAMNKWYSPDETYASGEGYIDLPTYKPE